MSSAFTRADQAGIYYTVPLGAQAAGLANSLGGARSAVEVLPVGFRITDGKMPPLIIEKVGRSVGAEGAESIICDDPDEIAYDPTSFAVGSAVAIADGETKLIESASASNYLRVTRDGTADLDSTENLGSNARLSFDIRKTFGGLLSVLNDAFGTMAANAYAAGMVFVHGVTDLTNIKIYIGTLGTQRVSGSAQLGGSGSGTITTATADGLADWPTTGGCRIEDSGGTLKEIVYYSARTSTSLTVPAAGRGILGTAATAGANTDKIYPVPLIRVGLEAVDADGCIQEIANATTAPTGITWTTAITAAAGLSVNLQAGRGSGLWFHRHVPSGATPASSMQNKISVEFDGYTQGYWGLYRIHRTTELMNVYVGTDAFPSFTAPTTTETALPFVVAIVPPVSGTKSTRIVVRTVDAVGLESLNTAPVEFVVDNTGALVNGELTPPHGLTLTDEASGYVRLRGRYAKGVDADPADTFVYYVTTDGTDPDPLTDTPVEAAMRVGNGLSEERILDVLLGPFAYSTDVRVLVRVLRSDDSEESENTTALQVTVATVLPPPIGFPSLAIPDQHFYGGDIEVGSPTVALSLGWFWVILPGCTELWNGAGLQLRFLLGGAEQTALYVKNDHSFVDGVVSGAGAAAAVQVASTTVLYFCVAGQRVAKVDSTAKTLTASSFSALETNTIAHDSPSPGPTLYAPLYTAVQVFDPRRGAWQSAMTVDGAGLISANNLRERAS